MQLVLYVHNHRDANPSTTPGRVCGMAVGEHPVAHIWDTGRPMTSFAEFRCPAGVEDPATEVGLAVAKAFAQAGALAQGQTLEYETPRCCLRLGLEPGFDDPHAVLEPLLQLARGLGVREGKLVNLPSAPLAP